MPFASSTRWLPARATLARLSLSLLFLLPLSARAQGDGGPTLLLRPHCAEDPCAPFHARDPVTQETPPLVPGALLDMDLILKNPLHQEISRVRAWLAYDPTILEGTQLSLADAFPLPSPGEDDFSPKEGYAKINVSADAGEWTGETAVIARLQMRVLSAPAAGTMLSFSDAGNLPENHTGIFRGAGPLEQGILDPESLGQLLVRLQTEHTNMQAALLSPENGGDLPAGEAPAAPPSAQPAAPAATPSDVFTLLQPQNLRVTTEGSSVFLAWDPLPSSQLIGYNLYYGTVSGKYLQRRSVDSATTSLTLRSLPQNTPYFFAVRGVADARTETAFSQEATVTVGTPASSSSPLRGSIAEQNRPRAHAQRNLAGDTGLPTAITLILLGSAGVGAALACRRQCIAAPLS